MNDRSYEYEDLCIMFNERVQPLHERAMHYNELRARVTAQRAAATKSQAEKQNQPLEEFLKGDKGMPRVSVHTRRETKTTYTLGERELSEAVLNYCGLSGMVGLTVEFDIRASGIVNGASVTVTDIEQNEIPEEG